MYSVQRLQEGMTNDILHNLISTWRRRVVDVNVFIVQVRCNLSLNVYLFHRGRLGLYNTVEGMFWEGSIA